MPTLNPFAHLLVVSNCVTTAGLFSITGTRTKILLGNEMNHRPSRLLFLLCFLVFVKGVWDQFGIAATAHS